MMQPRNALIPFELPQAANINALTQPLMQGIDTYRQGMKEQFEGERALARERMEGQRLAIAQDSHAMEREKYLAQKMGGLAQVIHDDTDQARAAANWSKLRASMPGMDAHLAKYGVDPNDHVSGARLIMGEAGKYQTANEREKERLGLQLQRSQIAGQGLQQQLTQAQLAQIRTQTPEWREQNAERFGLVKGTPEHTQFIVSGQYAPKDDLVHAKEGETVGQRMRQPDGSYKVVPVLEGGGKITPGYRRTDAGWEAIPGGPADIKQNEKRQQDYASMQSVFQQLDELAKSVNAVKTHPGLSSNFGMTGLIPNRPGSNAANAQALLDTLKVQGAFASLQEMRNASKTGGALGAVSDSEQKMLQNAIAPLLKLQSYEQAQKSLATILQHIEASKERIRGAYNDHWNRGGEAAKQPQLAPKPAESKTIGGKTYIKVDGQWYEQ